MRRTECLDGLNLVPIGHGHENFLGNGTTALEAQVGMLWTPRAPIEGSWKSAPVLSIQIADETADRVQLKMDAPLALGRHIDFALVISGLDQYGICGSLDRARAMIERKVALNLLHRAQAAPFKQVFARPAFARDGAVQKVAVRHWIDSSSNGAARKNGAKHEGYSLA